MRDFRHITPCGECCEGCKNQNHRLSRWFALCL